MGFRIIRKLRCNVSCSSMFLITSKAGLWYNGYPYVDWAVYHSLKLIKSMLSIFHKQMCLSLLRLARPNHVTETVKIPLIHVWKIMMN